MATTKTQKNTEAKEVAVKAPKKVKAVKVVEVKTIPSKILGLRITEKSARASEKGAYTFNVAVGTNKSEVMKAIKAQYKVTPVKVAITKIQKKTIVRRGKLGTKGGGTKAVVYLKKGDKIEFA